MSSTHAMSGTSVPVDNELHRALKKKNTKWGAFRKLLEYCDVNQVDHQGTPTLHLAIRHPKRFLLTRKLIDAGANINAVDAGGISALELAMQLQQIRTIGLLVLNDAIIIPKSVVIYFGSPSNDDDMCLKLANSNTIGHRKWDVIKKLLSVADGDTFVDFVDSSGKTLLWHACKDDEFVCAEKLLRLGADPNTGAISATPLHRAFQSRNLAIVNLLLDFGASVRGDPSKRFEYPIYMCIRYGTDEILQRLLQKGADVNQAHRVIPPLIIALTLAVQTSTLQQRDMYVSMAHTLLDNGACVFSVTWLDNDHPLDLAVRLGDVSLVEKIITANSSNDHDMDDEPTMNALAFFKEIQVSDDQLQQFRKYVTWSNSASHFVFIRGYVHVGIKTGSLEMVKLLLRQTEQNAIVHGQNASITSMRLWAEDFDGPNYPEAVPVQPMIISAFERIIRNRMNAPLLCNYLHTSIAVDQVKSILMELLKARVNVSRAFCDDLWEMKVRYPEVEYLLQDESYEHIQDELLPERMEMTKACINTIHNLTSHHLLDDIVQYCVLPYLGWDRYGAIHDGWMGCANVSETSHWKARQKQQQLQNGQPSTFDGRAKKRLRIQ